MSILLAVSILAFLALIFGAILGYSSIRFKVKSDPVIDQIDQILPQTQCGQCGFPGCRPYAEAIALGEAINKCPPGGDAGIRALANLLGKEIISLDAEHGEKSSPTLAVIRENECIGCTKCIQACPVDAILGAAKQMHTVIAEECTGCDLCIPPCPVDCIDILPIKQLGTSHWAWPRPTKKSDLKAAQS